MSDPLDPETYLASIAARIRRERGLEVEKRREPNEEESELLLRCVGDRYLTVFAMHRLGGLRYVEIGAYLGISPKRVERRMAVALHRIRIASELIREGRLPDIHTLPLGLRIRLRLGL